jgi:hypothetical protein
VLRHLRAGVRSTARNVEKGVKVAVLGACVLVAWTGLVRVVGGAGAFARHGVTYPQVALVYLIGGAAAGAIAGLMAPLARWRLGGVLVGVVAALPSGALMAYAKSGLLPWRDPGADTSMVAVSLIGAVVGWGFPGAVREIDARMARGRAARAEPGADHDVGGLR